MSYLNRITSKLFARKIKRNRKASEERLLQEYLNGHRNTALVYLAAKLRIADHLEGGPRDCRFLADTLEVDFFSLRRVFRAWVVLGLCRQEQDGRFSMTSMGRSLGSKSADSFYDMAILSGEEFAPAWNGLLHSVKTGEKAFNKVFGMSQWEHRKASPELVGCFNRWMAQNSSGVIDSILQAYDFSVFKTVVDLGGGNGTLLAALLQKHQAMTGILFDQAEVLAEVVDVLQCGGEASSRCNLLPGDFFDEIPAKADAFILKSVLHNWEDKKCLLLLQQCRTAMKEGQVLLVMEKLLPQDGSGKRFTVMADLQMLAVTGGRERSKEEYGKLLSAAGFNLKNVIPTGKELFILEAFPA